ncbi:hypothetical protein E8E13_010314 [Curvularia kusanoi]|uniref:Protein kinase domain-containing protein n=1 Tax=Curvularia kusanoi TaxID=90978 RepID=A0A9P4WEH8_CURKU|nr:hypothetical protein E8E13_010314 [Curvularia kusanoi]
MREDYDPHYFAAEIVRVRSLGEGADGQVDEYKHRPTGRVFAIKTPTKSSGAKENIYAEGELMKMLQKDFSHRHVSRLVCFLPRFTGPRGPALVYEMAEYGNVVHYRQAWKDQQYDAGHSTTIQEAQVWKLFRDMALALDFIHKRGVLHQDIKPDNIVVARPIMTSSRSRIPLLPEFKLCDFSRGYDTFARHRKPYQWCGTMAYAPPVSERYEPLFSSDMWMLGATLQEFALGCNPMMSRRQVIAHLNRAGEPCPPHHCEAKWAEAKWSWKFAACYRPLNVPKSELQHRWDTGEMSRSHRPFSDFLNEMYKSLFDENYERRATAKQLRDSLVPEIEKYRLRA